MGQCYSVTFKFKVKDYDGALRSVKAFIANNNANFHIDEFAQEGVDVKTFNGLMRVILAGWKCNQWEESIDGRGRSVFSNSFDASYGWESVMIDAFIAVAPYLADNSYIKIYPDSGVDYWIVRGGKAVCIE